jgi:predicted nucleic acid-binding Zn ribbon protein
MRVLLAILSLVISSSTVFAGPADSRFVCVAKGEGWYAVHDLAIDQQVGANVDSLTTCQRVLPTNSASLACVHKGAGWYAIFNMKSGSQLGANIGGFIECQQALPANAR